METFALTGASISLLRKREEKVSRRRLSFLRLVAALLASAASSSSAAGEIPLIRVERNVRVSSGNPERLHHEVGMAASPTDSMGATLPAIRSSMRRATPARAGHPLWR